MKHVKAIKKLLNAFMDQAAVDKRLMPSHLSLVMAVFYFMENTHDAVQVSRKKLMHFHASDPSQRIINVSVNWKVTVTWNIGHPTILYWGVRSVLWKKFRGKIE